MSLRVWLPLNGNLENKGLDDVTVINNGAIVDNNGKIGKCYSFGTSSYLKVPLPKLSEYSTTTFSMCLWAKVPSPTNNNKQFLHIGKGSGWANNRFTILYKGSTTVSQVVTSISDGNSYGAYSCYADIPIDTWVHIASVFDNKKLKLYINGELKNTYNTTYDLSFDSIEALGIGGAPNGAELLKSGYINDVRIYDHALSPMEIKQISQGLVLHYPLNHGGLGQENLLRHQIKDSQWTNWSNATTTREKIVINGKTWAHLIQTSSSGYGGYAINPSNNEIIIDNTKKYTWSCTAMAGTNTNAEIVLWLHWRSTEGGSNIAQSSKKFLLTTNPKRISYTIDPSTVNTSYTINRINLMMGTSGTVNNEIYFTDIKFEQGSIATPWCPNEADALATTMGLNDTIEYDCSGYGNNGTKIGTFDYSSDTPSYNVSTVFPTGNNYINAGRGAMVKDAITVNLWVNYSTWGNPISCTEGGGFNFESNGNLCFIQYISGIGYKVAQSTIAPSSLTNAWHMFTGTCDKENIYLYIDGELKGTGKVESTNAFGYNANNAIMIGAEANNSSTTVASASFIGKISDVRIYATALSPEDVLDLYNLGAAIDTNNNLYGVMLEEV